MTTAFQQGYQARKEFDGDHFPEVPFTTKRQEYLRTLWIKGWEAAEAELKQAAVEYNEGERS